MYSVTVYISDDADVILTGDNVNELAHKILTELTSSVERTIRDCDYCPVAWDFHDEVIFRTFAEVDSFLLMNYADRNYRYGATTNAASTWGFSWSTKELRS